MLNKVTDILTEAKDIVWKNKGQSFMAVVLPAIIAAFAILISLVFGRFAFIPIILIFIALVYATIKMQLSVVRTGNAYFGESLSEFKRAFKLFGYFLLVALVLGLIMFGVVYVLVWDEIMAFTDFLTSLESAGFEEIENISTQIDSFVADLRLVTIILMAINLLYSLKFFMVQYLIVDGTNVFEAIKRSWKETNPHLATIFLLSLFFVIANEVLGLVANVMANAGALGGLYSLAYLVFALIFWLAYQAIAPALLYVKMTGGEALSEPVIQEDVFTSSPEQKSDEEWDF